MWPVAERGGGMADSSVFEVFASKMGLSLESGLILSFPGRGYPLIGVTLVTPWGSFRESESSLEDSVEIRKDNELWGTTRSAVTEHGGGF